MHLKKIFICVAICLFFCGLADIGKIVAETRIIDIRYRCRIEIADLLWQILSFFFGFDLDKQDFFWREKTECGENGVSREITLFNKNREVVRFFARNGDFGAKIDFGGKYSNKELNASQAKTLFDIQDFIRSAKQGEVCNGTYQTQENNYCFAIEAKTRQELAFPGYKETITVLYFEGIVFRQEEKFLEIKFWMAENTKLKGQVVKCSFKKTFWPLVMIEIQ